jgi:hypothetical protein
VSALIATEESISGAFAGPLPAVTVTGTDGPELLKTARFPPFVPSICSVTSELEPVGSLVLVSEKEAVGSRRNNENVSGSEPLVGAFVVASTRNVIVEPKVMRCWSSLKKEALLSITVLGSVPVTDPVVEAEPIVPLVMKSEIEMVFVCVPPPAMKSNVSAACVPAKLDVLVVKSKSESARAGESMPIAKKTHRTPRQKRPALHVRSFMVHIPDVFLIVLGVCEYDLRWKSILTLSQ